MVVRMLPVFCATILFWTIYAQAWPRAPLLTEHVDHSLTASYQPQHKPAENGRLLV